mgnify:CR=1 FL=1
MKLILVFSYKYDCELVPDLLKNVEDFIDDYVAHDDRGSNKLWYHEGKIRNMLINKAKEKGADWILAVDPDERLEKSAGKKIRKLLTEMLNRSTIVVLAGNYCAYTGLTKITII